jgi:O-antigen/teichoic acid export membrane protein
MTEDSNPSVSRRRLSITVAIGLTVEVLNKIIPLAAIHIAQERIGIEGFGFAQFGISVYEILIPFITFGYNYFGIIEMGRNQDAGSRIKSLISRIIAAKLAHALIIFVLLFSVVGSVEHYRPYGVLLLVNSFVLLFSATDLMWVLIGIQRMMWVSIITGVGRFLGLILIYWLVQSPNDSVLYAALSLGSNGLISIASTVIGIRMFGLGRFNLGGIRSMLVKSFPYAMVLALILFYDRVDIILSEILFDLKSVGVYSGSARISLGITQIAYVIITIFFSEAVIVKDRDRLTRHLELGMWSLLGVALPAAVGSWFCNSQLLTFVLGPAFSEAGSLLSFQLTASVFGLIASVLCFQVLMIREKESHAAAILAVGLVVGTATALFLSRPLGLIGVALGMVAGKALMALLAAVASRPMIDRYPFRYSARVIIPVALMAVVLAAVGLQGALGTIALGGLTYAAALYLFNRALLTQVIASIVPRTRL